MSNTWLFRYDASMPFQTWNPFGPEDDVEVCNKYGDCKKGKAKDFWWGYETDFGETAEGVITKARRYIPEPTEDKDF